MIHNHPIHNNPRIRIVFACRNDPKPISIKTGSFRCRKMRAALTLSFAVAFLFSCERQSGVPVEKPSVTGGVESKKPLIRTISFNDTNCDVGVELNGDRAFMRQDKVEPKRIEIPYQDGLKLLEGFYAIPRIGEYLGKESDDRRTALQYLVVIYDEMPEHYSKEWVDYVIPKDSVALHPELNAWFENMRTTQKQAVTEQAMDGNPH